MILCRRRSGPTECAAQAMYEKLLKVYAYGVVFYWTKDLLSSDSESLKRAFKDLAVVLV